MSDKGVVVTPISKSPGFDAMQVMPLNTDRAYPINLSGGAVVHHTFAEDTEMAFIYVPLATDGSQLFVEVTRGDNSGKFFPLASGYWPWGTVGDPRSASFKLSSGSATIIVLEA